MKSASNEENWSSVRKKALLDYKYIDFTWSPYPDFFKRLTHDFDQQLYISSLLVSGQNKLWNNIW